MRISQIVVMTLLAVLVTVPHLVFGANWSITYNSSPSFPYSHMIDGASITSAYYIIYQPYATTYPSDEVSIYIDGNLVGYGLRDEQQNTFSLYYDFSQLSPGPNHFIEAYYKSDTADDKYTSAHFWTLGEVKFAVISDAHLCNPYFLFGDKCQYKSQQERRRDHLKDLVGAKLREDDDFIFTLGDNIENLYLIHDETTPHYYFKYVSESFPETPTHYVVLGNHDIRDGLSSIRRSKAKELFSKYSLAYGVTEFVETYKKIEKNGWQFFLMNSGESASTWTEGNCVQFNETQLENLSKDLDNLSGKTAILLWHVSPDKDVRRIKSCWDPASGDPPPAYVGVLKKYAKKIKAVFTGHVHVNRFYIMYDTDYVYLNPDLNYRPGITGIQMYTVISTGQPAGDWEGTDLFMEASLHADGTLSIDNKDNMLWTPFTVSATPTPDVSLENEYRQTDTCFELDNNGNGWFDDDEIDCPDGTSIGTELDHDYDQQIYTIEAKLKKNDMVLNYTPGQYHAVSTVTNYDTTLENLWIFQSYADCTNQTPPISKLNPTKGGGALAVVVVGPDGVARQIANAKTLDYTDQDSGISVVAVENTDTGTAVHLQNVPTGYQVKQYVKFAPGLKHELFTEGSSCDIETSIWLDETAHDLMDMETFSLEVVDNK